jgi:hypothetical protein
MAGKEQDPFVLTEYVTAEELVAHYGSTLAALPLAQQTRYVNYALNSNREVSSFLYRWVDQLPLQTGSAALEYSKGMAFKYAQRLKQIDDGAVNVVAFEKLYPEDKAMIAEVLKAQPQQVNTRRMIANGYPDIVPPYSQSYGLSDIL